MKSILLSKNILCHSSALISFGASNSLTCLVVFILNLAKVLNIFEPIFVLYNSSVLEVSDVIGTYVYRIGIINQDYGMSTAAGLFKSVVSLVLVIAANKFSKKINGEGIL